MNRDGDVLDLLAKQLADPETAWSMGTFGAIAEFTHDADETIALAPAADAISMVTPRGAIKLDLRLALCLVTSESPTTESWSHRAALCLPENDCAMSRRVVLSEVGPDRDALRDEDKAAVVFDLGLGALQVDVCVRSDDQNVISELRRCVGKPVLAPDSKAMAVILAASPHRIFASRLGRIEVYQPIPRADGRSPGGPHTHVLPKLLAHGRGHRAGAGRLDSVRSFLSSASAARPQRRSPAIPARAPRRLSDLAVELRRSRTRCAQASGYRRRNRRPRPFRHG